MKHTLQYFQRRYRRIRELKKQRYSLSEIGRRFKISKQRVSMIISSGLPSRGIGAPRKHGLTVRGFRGRKRGLQGRDLLREKIRIRDNHTCQICKKKWREGQRAFDTHHLDGKYEGKSNGRGMYEIDKLNPDKMITLCHKCHLNLPHLKEKFKNTSKIKVETNQ